MDGDEAAMDDDEQMDSEAAMDEDDDEEEESDKEDIPTVEVFVIYTLGRADTHDFCHSGLLRTNHHLFGFFVNRDCIGPFQSIGLKTTSNPSQGTSIRRDQTVQLSRM